MPIHGLAVGVHRDLTKHQVTLEYHLMVEPLTPPAAKKQIRSILEIGTVHFTGHALEELAKDGFDTGDALNVLRAGIVEPAELVGKVWRYRVRTARMYVVVQFRSDTELLAITGWRLK